MMGFLRKHIPPKRIRFYGYCCCVTLLLAAATLVGRLTLDEDDQRRVLPFMVADKWEPTAKETTFSGNYLASRFARANKDYASAAEYADKAMQLDAKSDRLKSLGLKLMLAAGNIQQAEELAEKISIQQPKPEPLVVLAYLGKLMREERYEEAEELIRKSEPNGMYQLIQPVLLRWAEVGQMLSSAKDKSAILSFKGVSLDGFLGPFMQYQRGLMNDLLGLNDAAMEAYAAASSSPSLTPYRVVQAIANFYLRAEKPEKARQVYADYALHHPDSLFETPQISQNSSLSPLVASASDGMAEIYFTAASLLFGERASQETLLYLRLALASRPDFPPAQMMLAGLFEQQEKYSDAVEVYQSIDAESVFFKQGRIRVALNYRAAGQEDAAIELLERMIAESPDAEEAIMLLGDIYRFADDYRLSAKTFSDALSRLPDHDWSWPFYYKYAISLERMKSWNESEVQFNKALELSPDEPDVLNYLGYSLLERRENVEKAMKLIRKAYDQEPGEAHIIDSMGWAYFLTGEFDKAVELLEEAVGLAPQDSTINDHLGDAYWRVGRKLEADFQWSRALTFEPAEPEKIKTKLEQGLPSMGEDS